MIEIKSDFGIDLQEVVDTIGDGVAKRLGHVVKTHTKRWIAIPLHSRNLPPTEHKRRREALEALKP